MSDMNNPSDENTGALDDLWADALNEQNHAHQKCGRCGIPAVRWRRRQRCFAGHRPNHGHSGQTDRRTGPYPHDHQRAAAPDAGSVVALDGLAGEPLDILINGYLIARGEVVVVADKYGVRITDIITPSERMRRLSR